MLKKIALGLLAFFVALIAIVAMQPSDFKIQRSAKINAPADVVFAQIQDFHKWEAWSPWAKLDPAMTQTYSGPEAGKDAEYTWSGNDDVGEGKMKIFESVPASKVLIDLEFLKPMAAKNLTEFTLTPSEDETEVVWTMTGKNNFVGKAFFLFMNMDKMVGADFEKGLASMKSIAESEKSSTAEAAPLAEKEDMNPKSE